MDHEYSWIRDLCPALVAEIKLDEDFFKSVLGGEHKQLSYHIQYWDIRLIVFMYSENTLSILIEVRNPFERDKEAKVTDFLEGHLRELILENTPYVIGFVNSEKQEWARHVTLELIPAQLSRNQLLERVARANQQLSDQFNGADNLWLAGVQKEWRVLLKKVVFAEPSKFVYRRAFSIDIPPGVPHGLPISERYNWVLELLVQMTDLEENGDFTLLCEISKAGNFDKPSNVYWRKARQEAIAGFRDDIYSIITTLLPTESGWSDITVTVVDGDSRHFNPHCVGFEVSVK